MDKPQTYIFIGISGSGKGTQINLLKNHIAKINPEIDSYSFVMGDTLRSFMKDDGYAQNMIKEITNQGLLVPDLITNSLFVSELLSSLKPTENLFIDGIPRSINQAQAIIEFMNFYNRSEVVIINIEVGQDEAKKRMLLRKRPDDNEDSINERFNFYKNNVLPAIEYLKEKSDFKYILIDGEKTIEEIHLDILKSLNL
ncbi:MAG: nucleoside monophosphate kinase [Candidatus Pacebacteria bacterium]|nr:nucleoside monophosphate kinase [Candidatus Paceibacterota bacterium]